MTLLHNTGMRPRTETTWTVPPTNTHTAGPDAVRFCWPSNIDFEVEDLDEAWARAGLVGAILMLPVTSISAFDTVMTSRDAVLCANVLGRTRGMLLTATAPFCTSFPSAQALVSDDRRLIALATEAKG